jgi:probable F420-dependent oxidoreductase
VKVDGGLDHDPRDPASAARRARQAVTVGHDRLYASEMAHDPFLPIALAAGVPDIEFGTNIAVAFARSPMTVASTAHDLHALTAGRFTLGLGTQVKAHITRRFAMPWSRPAERMREFVLAVRAIWASWEHGTRLHFEGEFYQHTLSAPLFDPGPTGLGTPPIYVAAVGPRMTEVTGEVADGLLCHGFTSPDYLADVTLPALRRGISAAGRTEQDVQVSLPVFVATGPPGADLGPQLEPLRRQIAFYGSTPAYRGVLDHHGWGDLHEELHTLSRAQRWTEMSRLIDDDVLHTIAVAADASELAKGVRHRYGGIASRVQLGLPYLDDPDTWAPVIAALKKP